MKRILLVVLMILIVATTCFAQEVETEGLFSAEGTLWGMCTFTYTKHPLSYDIECDSEVGFYQGGIYGYMYGQHGSFHIQEPSYYDLFLVSIAVYYNPNPLSNDSFLAIMQPSGLGVFSWGNCEWNWMSLDPDASYCDYGIGIMHKINDNWTPSEME